MPTNRKINGRRTTRTTTFASASADVPQSNSNGNDASNSNNRMVLCEDCGRRVPVNNMSIHRLHGCCVGVGVGGGDRKPPSARASTSTSSGSSSSSLSPPTPSSAATGGQRKQPQQQGQDDRAGTAADDDYAQEQRRQQRRRRSQGSQHQQQCDGEQQQRRRQQRRRKKHHHRGSGSTTSSGLHHLHATMGRAVTTTELSGDGEGEMDNDHVSSAIRSVAGNKHDSENDGEFSEQERAMAMDVDDAQSSLSLREKEHTAHHLRHRGSTGCGEDPRPPPARRHHGLHHDDFDHVPGRSCHEDPLTLLRQSTAPVHRTFLSDPNDNKISSDQRQYHRFSGLESSDDSETELLETQEPYYHQPQIAAMQPAFVAADQPSPEASAPASMPVAMMESNADSHDGVVDLTMPSQPRQPRRRRLLSPIRTSNISITMNDNSSSNNSSRSPHFSFMVSSPNRHHLQQQQSLQSPQHQTQDVGRGVALSPFNLGFIRRFATGGAVSGSGSRTGSRSPPAPSPTGRSSSHHQQQIHHRSRSESAATSTSSQQMAVAAVASVLPAEAARSGSSPGNAGGRRRNRSGRNGRSSASSRRHSGQQQHWRRRQQQQESEIGVAREGVEDGDNRLRGESSNVRNQTGGDGGILEVCDFIDLMDDEEDEEEEDNTQSWACSRCTLLNPDTEIWCQACFSPRGISNVEEDDLSSTDPEGSMGLRRNLSHPYVRQAGSAGGSSDPPYLAGVTVFGGALDAERASAYRQGRSVPPVAAVGAASGSTVDNILLRGENDAGIANGDGAVPRAASVAVMPVQPSVNGGHIQPYMMPREMGHRYRHPPVLGRTNGRRGGVGGDSRHDQRYVAPDPVLMHLMNALLAADVNDAAALMGAHGGVGNANVGVGNDQVDGMSYEQLLQAFGNGTENLGADEGVILSLPTAIVKDPERELPSEFRECSICLEEFAAGDTRKTLPCLHGFHEDCVNRWLVNNAACPICKNRVGDDDDD